MAGRLELGAQRGEVLDDPVVHQRDPAGGAEVRVRVGVVGRAVGGPAGVPDAGRRRRQRVLRERLVEVRQLAGALLRGDLALVDQGDARGVVAAVLQPAETGDHHTLGLLRSDVPDDSTHGRHSTGGAAPARTAHACHNPRHGFRQRRRCVRPRASAGRPGVGSVRRARPGRVGGARSGHRAAVAARGDRPGPRARRRARPRRGAAGLPAAVPAAEHVRRELRRPAPRAGGVPGPAAAAAHAVRDRPGRLGGGRQVDDRPGAAADARALARAPVGRAGHHRRLPVPQRRAGAPGADGAQGLPGVLRPQGAAALRDGHQVRQGRGRGPDVLPPGLRRGPRGARRRRAAPTS